MTATRIIEEIQALEPGERALVVEFVHKVEEREIPDDFLKALEELRAGKTIPMADENFDQPPA